MGDFKEHDKQGNVSPSVKGIHFSERMINLYI